MIFPNSIKVLFLLAAVLSLLACTEDQSKPKKRPKDPHLVETGIARIKPVSISKTLPGTLETVRSIKIFNQEEGLLIRLPHYEGDIVKKGDLLAKLDDALIKADFNKARASLKQYQLDLKRLKDLVPRKLASDDEVAKAQTAVDIAQAELNQNQARFTRTQIYAPLNGTISERLAEPGDVIPIHSHLLTLIDTSSLKARVHVSELLLPLIQLGDEVAIKIDALAEASDSENNKPYRGRITRLHPTIDTITRSGTIEIKLDPVPPGALPGQLCRITLKTQNRNRLMIPFDAVRHNIQGAYVYVVENNRAVQQAIHTGLENRNEIEVLEGLKENDIVVVKGFFGLKNDMVIKIKDVTNK
ncbi:MAG: efflux RND transporter periplasmic adaptor subunit [Gammaproteobacteria bacterium]|nr:efflux RND transporter periplasmic adaptor subunit [Gammaproteobacteria bacterium]